jgi:hypothetical protein
MRTNEKSLLWVVYRMTIRGKPSGMNAVCQQSDWEAMERAQPGYHTLVQAGITNEGEAERLARSGTVGREHEQLIRTEATTALSETL